MCLFLKKLTLWPKKVYTPTGDVDTLPNKVDSGVTGQNHCCNLQKSPISSRFLGVFGRKKSLFLGPILPDFGSFLCFVSLVADFVMCCYSAIYGIWYNGEHFVHRLWRSVLEPHPCYFLQMVLCKAQERSYLGCTQHTFSLTRISRITRIAAL